MKILGIDFGLRRIGLAVADTHAGIAFGRGVLDNRGSENAVSKIGELCKKESVQKIILGLPRSADTSDSGTLEATVQDFGAKLSSDLGIPVEFIDERFSSQSVIQEGRSHDADSQKVKNAVDEIVAQRLLMEWMAYHKEA